MKKIQQSYGYRLKPSQILKLHIEKKINKKNSLAVLFQIGGVRGVLKKEYKKKTNFLYYIYIRKGHLIYKL